MSKLSHVIAIQPAALPKPARLAWRWIAAGQGCDSSLVVQRKTNIGISPINAPKNTPTMATDAPARARNPDPLPPPAP